MKNIYISFKPIKICFIKTKLKTNQWQNISDLNQSKFNEYDNNQSEFSIKITNHVQIKNNHMTEINQSHIKLIV